MVIKKTIGYVLAAIGLILFALSYQAVRTAFNVPLPAGIKENYAMIAGVVILIIGVFMAFKSSRERLIEVPIYVEEKIIGYRRVKK